MSLLHARKMGQHSARRVSLHTPTPPLACPLHTLPWPSRSQAQHWSANLGIRDLLRRILKLSPPECCQRRFANAHPAVDQQTALATRGAKPSGPLSLASRNSTVDEALPF